MYLGSNLLCILASTLPKLDTPLTEKKPKALENTGICLVAHEFILAHFIDSVSFCRIIVVRACDNCLQELYRS